MVVVREHIEGIVALLCVLHVVVVLSRLYRPLGSQLHIGKAEALRIEVRVGILLVEGVFGCDGPVLQRLEDRACRDTRYCRIQM